ncbi:hypothetical protein AB0942_09540 [Streptomyces nodosus]|uniref:hypothetical protein n=1 Tax=Streptomyces nodosus TaxID=40318 RepID=UPI0034543AC3
MDLIAKVACRRCPTAIELTVRSAEHAEKELETAGWTQVSGDDGHLCPACSKPPAERSGPYVPDPSSHGWSAWRIMPVLRVAGFAHEPGGAIWRSGPDFCWEESVWRDDDEWVDGAELCVRVHYAVGRAKREGSVGTYTAADRAHHRAGLDRLTRYLADQGYSVIEDARGREKTHLIVYQLAGHESDVPAATYA